MSQEDGDFPSDSSSPPSDGGNDETFYSLLRSLSQKWINAQLTHDVSLAATSVFWKLAFEYIPEIIRLKESEGVKKKIPQFMQIRNTFYSDYCPKIRMSFAFLNKEDNSIIHVKGDRTPLNQYQRDPQYKKLYEEAHVEVSSM